MAVFPEEHQGTIDKVNHDGWRYLAERVDKIVEAYHGKGGILTGMSIGVRVNGMHFAPDRSRNGGSRYSDGEAGLMLDRQERRC